MDKETHRIKEKVVGKHAGNYEGAHSFAVLYDVFFYAG